MYNVDTATGMVFGSRSSFGKRAQSVCMSTFVIHAGLMDLRLLLESLNTTVSYAGCVASYPVCGL